MMTTRPTSNAKRDDRGASLILALIFVFAVGLALVAIGGLATTSLRNTSNLQQLRSSESSAEAATTVALRYVQTSYAASIYSHTLTSCLPGAPGATVDSTVVSCVEPTIPSPPPGYSRLVDFYACPSSTVWSACTAASSSLVLHAQVAYSDWSFTGANACSSSSQATCGSGIALESWDVIHADT